MKYPKEVHELRGELQAAVDGRIRNISATGLKCLIDELNGFSANPSPPVALALVLLRELERDSEAATNPMSIMCDHCGIITTLPGSWPSGRQSVLCGHCNRLNYFEAP